MIKISEPLMLHEEPKIYLDSVELDLAMDDELPCLIRARRITTPKHDDIDPPFQFSKHQTAQRRLTGHSVTLGDFLAFTRNVFPPIGTFCQVPRRRSRVFLFFPMCGLVQSHVRKSFREVPPLKFGLANIVPMISAHESFTPPTLLE